jgi:outer membrane protein TolC
MRALVFLALLGIAHGGLSSARAEPAARVSQTDAVLAGLIQQSLAARPELARGQATVNANEERVPQARALPDPMLQLGIQNDGFRSIEIGRAETSYVSVMASQTFPWPGKLALQGSIAELGVSEAKYALTRLRLSTEAEVRRAYLGLVLARERLEVLERLRPLLQAAVAVTRAAYQTSGGSQADVLRAELEVARLEQRRLTLQSRESVALQALNRLRGHPFSEPIVTPDHLESLPPLEARNPLFSPENALMKSPELGSARLAITRAERAGSLAERGSYPDLTVGAGVMFRGQLPPMWQLTLGGPVPVFSASKQSRAVAENRAWASAARSQVDELVQLIRQRSKEREAEFAAVAGSVAVYEQGLLIRSKASAESALIQYRAGKASLVSVFEANAGYLSDQENELMAIARAHELLIAEAEVSLAPTVMLTGASQ